MPACGAAWLRPGIFLFLLCILCNAAAGEKSTLPGKFRFVRSAELPSGIKISPNNTYAVNLDEVFFQSIENPANDLCILDSSGNIVPFVLQKVPAANASSKENQLTGRIVRNQQLPDGRNAIDFELDKKNNAISSVELVGGRLAVGTQLTIAIGDGKNWQTAVDKLPLSDISKLPEGVNRRFTLPRQLTGKVVRLIVEKGSFPALEAVRVFELQQLEPTPGALIRQYNISAMGSKSENGKLKIAFNTAHTPLTSLKVKLNKELYYSKVTVLGSNDRRKWNEISSGSIRSIDLDRADTLDFPESRYKFIMLHIEHPPESPVKISSIKASGPAYRWVVKGSKEYRKLTICYNSQEVIPTANYQIISANRPAAAYLVSTQQPNKLHKTGVRDRNSWNHLAGALIVVLALVSTLAITGSVKRSGQLLPED